MVTENAIKIKKNEKNDNIEEGTDIIVDNDGDGKVSEADTQVDVDNSDVPNKSAIKAFFEQMVSEGMSDDEIYDELKAEGFEDAEIDEIIGDGGAMQFPEAIIPKTSEDIKSMLDSLSEDERDAILVGYGYSKNMLPVKKEQAVGPAQYREEKVLQSEQKKGNALAKLLASLRY